MLTPSIAGSAKLQTLPTNAASKPEFSGLPIIEKNSLLNNDAVGDLRQFVQALTYERRLKARKKLRLNKSNPVSLTEVGEVYFANKKYGRARDAFLNALRNDNTYIPAYIKLIETLLLMGKPANALKQAQRGIFYTDSHIALRNKGLMCKIILINKDKDRGLDITSDTRTLSKEFVAILEEGSGNEETINLYGIFFATTLRNYERSLEEFEKLLQLNSQNLDGLNNTGLSYWNMGQVDKAIEYIQKALEVNPRFSSAYQNLISISALSGKFDEALNALDQAIENKIDLPSEWDLVRGYLLIEKKDYKAALNWHIDIETKYKRNDRYLNNVGYCYEKLGDSDKAIECYERSIDALFAGESVFLDQPLHQFYNLMILARANNKNSLVQSTASKLLNIDPNDPAAYYFLNGEKIGRSTASFAERALRKRIEINPGDASAYGNLTFIQTSINQDYDEAIKIIESASEEIKSHVSVFNNLVYAYIKKKNLAKASELLKSSVAKQHGSHLHATRGLLELYKGNFSEAKKLYEKAIEYFSGDEASMKFAKQVWAFEKGNYFWGVKDEKKAVSSLEAALALGDVSYAFEDARRLLEEINS